MIRQNMADQEQSNFYVAFNMSLCAFKVKKTMIVYVSNVITQKMADQGQPDIYVAFNYHEPSKRKP